MQGKIPAFFSSFSSRKPMTGKDVPMSDTRNDLPLGFSAGAAAAGFKKAGRDDLGLIVSDRPAVLAGLFTTNAFKAAPVQVCQQTLREYGTCRAVLVNSGQANACTGDEGLENCLETRRMVAALTGLAPHEIMPMSTGVIGDQLKMDRWREAVPSLVESLDSRDAEGFTRAFMTTDAFPKFASITVPLSGGTVRLTGMAKGAGMICPNMATMLAVMLTDADVDRETWQAMFARAVDKTFNRVSVDGDTSTNDMVAVLANGMAGNQEITVDGPDFDAFMKALNTVTVHLCRSIAGDGEGATKLLECVVTGAAEESVAKTVAKSVICSSLTKAAMFGADANWGRVLCAIGYSGAPVDIHKVDVAFKSPAGTVEVCKNGAGIEFSEEEAKKVLLEKEITIQVELNSGTAGAVAWGCDLTYEYVKINGDYRT